MFSRYSEIEYYTEIMETPIEERLTKIGKEGWDLICILDISGGRKKFIFKRLEKEEKHE